MSSDSSEIRADEEIGVGSIMLACENPVGVWESGDSGQSGVQSGGPPVVSPRESTPDRAESFLRGIDIQSWGLPSSRAWGYLDMYSVRSKEVGKW